MGLVGYASSDEEDETSPQVKGKGKGKEAIPVPTIEASHLPDIPASVAPSQVQVHDAPIGPHLPPDPTIYGPQLIPQPSPSIPSPNRDTDTDADTDPRALIHSLTLPAIPNLSIPPSPPSSPPPACNAKFQSFLALKRQGTHFNHKLQASASLRNPSLMDKLLAYADVGDAAQYETTLPPELWDPHGFPEWAFREPLRRSRERIAKRKQAGGKTAVEFVPAVNQPAEGERAGGLSRSRSRSEDRAEGWR